MIKREDLFTYESVGPYRMNQKSQQSDALNAFRKSQGHDINAVNENTKAMKESKKFHMILETEELVHEIQTAPLGSLHTINDVVEAAKRGQSTVYYQDTALTVDTQHKSIVIGDVRNEKDVVTVSLTNGYDFSFCMKDVGKVKGILDLFCPEDIRRILEAISNYNHAQKKQMEIEKNQIHIGESQEEIEQEKKNGTRNHPFANEMRPKDVYKKNHADTIAANLFYDLSPKMRMEAELKKKRWKAEKKKEKEI